MISLGDPVLGEDEKEALGAVIDGKWLTMGERVGAFEKAFAELHGAENAVAVNSCTAGLHLCLIAFGLGPGDEVLVPALTFVATVNAIMYTGATPIFVDIEGIDLPHMSLDDGQAKCTPRTKAVIVMHYGGYLVNLPLWHSFADNHGLILIEDAAHAPATGEVGRWGDASVFSFFTNKNMTTAEGGMLLALDPSVLEQFRYLRSHGMTTNTLDRYRGHAYTYDVTMLGYNYRMDELRAAIGLVQLARLANWNARRRQLTDYYHRCLSAQRIGVSVPFSSCHETAAHLMPILLKKNVNRASVMEQLRQAGIQTSIHYPPVHLFSYYKKRFPETDLPITEEYFARELSLPLHPSLNEKDVEIVVDALRAAISGA